MRKRSRLTIGLVLIMLLVMMSGCGAKKDAQEQGAQEQGTPESIIQETTQEKETKETEAKEEITAEKLISKMITAAEGAVVTKSDSKLLLQAFVGDNNRYMTIDNLYTSHNEYDKETVASTSNMTVENPGGSFNAVYNLVEEQGVLYYYANEGDSRIKYESFLEKEEISRNFVSSMNLANAEILGFETEGVQYNGKDVYKLSVKLKDADIRELIFEAGMKWLFWAKEYATVDLSDIIVTMDYYVDPQTAQVVKVEAGLEGMKNMLTEFGISAYSCYFGNVLDIVELHQCKLVYENISYEDYTLPKMSFEDKKNSVLVHQKDVGYTISMLDTEVEVICPAGWSVEEVGDNYIYLVSADENIYVQLMLDYNYTSEDFLNDDIAGWVEYEKEYDYVSDGPGAKIGDFDTYEIICESGIDAFAYTTIGDEFLAVVVNDYTTTNLEWALENVLNRVHIVE